jgi:hypothetical protein
LPGEKPGPLNIYNHFLIEAADSDSAPLFSSYSVLSISPAAYRLSSMALAESGPSFCRRSNMRGPHPHIIDPHRLRIMKKHRNIITIGNIHQKE